MFIIRAFIYLFGLAAVAQLIALEAFELGANAEYGEQSLTESLQDLFAFASSVLFFICAYFSKPLRQACVLLGALTLMMFVRESDAFLDQNVFDGAWQVIVLIILLSVIVGLRKQVKLSYESLRRFSDTSSYGFVTCGMVIILAFSRLMGRGDLWKNLMGEGYVRVVKNIVEEGTELLGYSIVMITAVELVVFVIAALKKEKLATAQ